MNKTEREARGDEVRKETRYSGGEGDDHPRGTHSWSTGSEQRSAGMQKRREVAERERERERGRKTEKNSGDSRGDHVAEAEEQRSDVGLTDSLSSRLCKQTKMDCE